MTRRTCWVLGAVLLCSFLASAAFAKPGPPLTFHGPLHDRDGKRVTGPADLTFRVFDAPAGGKLVAGPFGPFRAVPVGGIYSAALGPAGTDLSRGGKRWLEVSVRGSPLPRTELERVFYDEPDPGGKLAGGRTLMPWSPAARAPSAEQRSTLNVVTILDNGPPSNRLDLVLVGDGYTATALDTYAVHTENIIDYLFSQEPFKSYKHLFNVHRVDVISNESGVDNDPSPGIYRDTALDMAFFCGGTERLLCVDVWKAYQAASAAPGADQILALANSVKYGGAGYSSSDLATVSGGNGFAADVGVHEMGHSLGNLADEYDYGNGERYEGPETDDANTSILAADSMAVSGIKWARWLGDPGVGFSGLVGTYEGAAYKQFGIYRPTENSKMRNLGPPFNLPSAENLILEFYRIVRPIDDATPVGTELDQFSTAFVVPAMSLSHPIAIQWYLDGEPIPGATQPTFEVSSGAFELGAYTLSVAVRDMTPLVRDEAARTALMSETRSWPLLIGDRRPRVAVPASVAGLEETTLSFDVSAVDPDGDAILSLTATGSAIVAGGAFSEDPSHASGTFSWTPDSTQAGVYEVTFEALNVLPGRATTAIRVIDNDLPPVVTAPSGVTGPEGAPLSFLVTAEDPDGHPITSLTASGSAIVAGGAFTANGSNASGIFSWTPGFDRAGGYSARFVAANVYADTVTTSITVTNVDQAPTVLAIPDTGGREGIELYFEVYAEDPDNEAIQSLAAAGTAIDAGAVFTTDPSNAQGVFRWTPGFDQAGGYSVMFTAANALPGTAITTITIADANRAPVVGAPSRADGAEGVLLAFDVSAIDPDGEPIDSLTVGPLPAGAEFNASPTPASPVTGAFRWTPDYGQAGSYTVLLSAKSACRAIGVSGALICDAGSATVALEVGNTDRAPLVVAPTIIEVAEGAPVAFEVSATDPDGEPILAWAAEPLPGGALLIPGASGATAAFSWTPAFDQAGGYTITFTASNALEGTAETAVTVRDVDRPPAVTAPAGETVSEGVELAFLVAASDPDQDEIASLEALDVPVGATFTVSPDRTSGEFRWTPGFDQAGGYLVSFRAANAGTAVAATQISVRDVNRPPVADPGGPYQAVENIPLAFDGSGSIDPDGGPLEYLWEFGDGVTSSSRNPSHAYGSSGIYTVALTVGDAGLPPARATATTSATVVSVFPARIFFESAYRTIRLGSGKPLWCAQCEPVGGNFAPAAVDPHSVVATYEGRSIAAIAGKSVEIGDSDRNGIDDLELCFSKADLRILFDGLPEGQNTVFVDVGGTLIGGARIRGLVVVEVVSGKEALAASLAPNPVRGDAVLTFRTVTAGPTRVELYDLRGRRVAILANDPGMAAGYHDVPLRTSTSGMTLASGIYFYRVETADGTVTGRFAVMK